MKSKKLLTTFLILMVVLLAGCKKDDFVEIDVICPIVISTSPANLEVGVFPLSRNITATFNTPMNPASFVPESFTLQQGTSTSTIFVTGVLTYDENTNTMTFNPTTDLLENTTYTATISRLVKDTLGNWLGRDYVWTFSTGIPFIPLVISTSPEDLEEDVLPLNRDITATFNTTMNPAGFVPASFTLQQGTSTSTIFLNGVLSYDVNTNTMTFNPTDDLLENTTYTATISGSVEDLLGNLLGEDYVWTFSTGAPISPPVGVDLGTAERFGILSGVGISNNAGESVINNLDVGIYPGARSSITGFLDVDGGPGLIVNGEFFAADDAPPVPAMLIQAKADLVAAYLFAEAATDPAPQTVAGDLGGQTLAPGIYKSTSTLLIQAGDLTLDAQGDANAVWIFQIASDFTTIGGGPFPSPTGGNVILTGGAQAGNVYWQVGSSATIGDYTSFNGNILALTSITMNSFAQATGRMLCQNGSVTLTSTNIINRP